jgi:hypothetical protein
MVPIKPTQPNPIAAALKYETIRRRAIALGKSFTKAKQGDARFSAWREQQLRSFVEHTPLYAVDLQLAYENDRVGPVAQAMRNLMEIYIGTQYTRQSEKNAKRFYHDAARDVRDTMEVLQKFYTKQNNAPEQQLTTLLKNMKSDFAKFNVQDYEDNFTRVSDAAEEIGRGDVHGPLFKVASKFAHPTALLLVMEKPVPGLIDSFYEGGVGLALMCLSEVENSIRDVYPDLVVEG